MTPGFGFGFALRVLKPDAVRQVTHSMMDARGRTDRNSAAQDQHIQGFGIEEYGEVVSRLAGKLGETSLTLSRGRKQSVQISGTDALKIHLGAEPNNLLADLAELNRIATALGGSASGQVCLDGVTRELREGLALTSGERRRFCPGGCGEAESDLRGIPSVR